MAALPQPGSNMEAEVILLELNAVSAREDHFRSLYTSVMLTFEHYPRRISTQLLPWDLITLRIET
jgi:hypothetical protein